MAGIPLRGGWGGSNQSLTGLALPGAVPAMPGRTQPPYYGQYDPNQHTLVFGPTTHRIYDYSTSLNTAGPSVLRSSSAMYLDSSGVLQTVGSNVIRYDNTYNGSTWVPAGILIEETSATNFSDPDISAGWWNGFVNCSAGTAVTGITGSAGANQLTPSTSGSASLHYTSNASGTGPSVISAIVKANGYNQYTLREGSAAGVGVVFNLTGSGSVVGSFSANAGADTPSNATITALGGGYYRVSFVGTNTSGSNNFSPAMVVTDAWTSGSGDPWSGYTWTSDGTHGVIVERYQTEIGKSVPSSPIPGTSSGLTRAAETLSITVGAANQVILTFDDLSTQTFSNLTPFSSAQLTPLNRSRILYIDDNAAVAGATYTGTAQGDNTAVAVGAWLQSGDGSSTGANTTTAVGAKLQAGDGSSAGANTATATGHWLQSGTGSSAGANTATATGAELQAGAGSATGSNTATAVGAWLQAGVGSAAGDNTATAAAAPIQARAGTSAGSNTATAVGAWLQSGVGSSTGANTSTATGAELQAGIGSSAGSNTATATGAKLQSGVGSSAGTDTVTGTGHWLQSGVGNAQGDNTSSGYSPGASNVGSSSGTNTATAVGAWLQSGVGSSAGSNTASGVGLVGGVVTGDGLAVGANIAVAIGAWLQTATGTAIGGNVANAVSAVTEADFNADFAEDFSGYPGHALPEASFNNDFNDDFPTYVTPFIVEGVGVSVGGNIATAVSTIEVFIPPVYPPVVVPVKVWHPAQEYHRVQAPRATRIYRRGTELQRRSPLGMKRRYG
jgi:hypothetical protein